ncbi:hypothetical protein Acr_00g0008560 [Actinidia rufa]|uniref:Bromo domain-containing protein n=1 Tax=Actinidia rufa TaxID=165716 RepID=A0A7J0D8P7_9ERIC|nr:hypothetical protein Acr_00g0008560 [Actinidia rufa]
MSAGFFPSKMITTENIVKKKPKVKIASKRIEANSEAGSCVFLKTEIMNNKRGRDVLDSVLKLGSDRPVRPVGPAPGQGNGGLKWIHLDKIQLLLHPLEEKLILRGNMLLRGKSGEVGPCKKVPADIRFRMEECLKAIREKKRPSEEAYEQSIPYGPDDGDDDAILEIGDDIDLECFGNTNIIDEPNAQDGRDDSENNEDENEDDWLTRGNILVKFLLLYAIWNWTCGSITVDPTVEPVTRDPVIFPVQPGFRFLKTLVLESKNKKSETNKSQKSVIPSSGKMKLYAADNLKVKSSALGTKKHGLEVVKVCRKEKRRKMDGSATQQCYKVFRELMTHPAGRVFNQPVDPVKLHIPDYFSIISEPMDLGTINTKLANYPYSSVEAFATDVRLTFSNAMFYYPCHTDVHKMAKELDDLFDTRWRSLEAKWNHGRTIVEPRCMPRGSEKNTRKLAPNGDRASSVRAGLLPKTLTSAKETQKFWNWGRTNVGQRRTSAEEMQKFREQILEVSRGKISQQLQGLLKKLGSNCVREENIELDIDAFVEETLMELKGIIRSFIGARVTKHKMPMQPSKGLCQFILEWTMMEKSRSSSQMSKSDLDSDGSARALAQERICSLNEPSSGEDCTPLVDVQLSRKMALRAAKLRSRYAKIILKANTFLAHVAAVQGDKADLVLLQKEKEKESLKRQQREEKFKTEAAQTRVAEAASRTELKRQREQERKAASRTELKKQRVQERKAARLALEQMERTIEIDDNLVSLKDLNDMLRGSWSDTNPAVVGGIHVGKQHIFHWCHPSRQKTVRHHRWTRTTPKSSLVPPKSPENRQTVCMKEIPIIATDIAGDNHPQPVMPSELITTAYNIMDI